MKIEKGPVQSVSIIMPTYNESGNIADLIKEAEWHVVSSGIKNIQIIVVDDNSPDETWKIASGVSCDHARVEVLAHGERGLTLITGIARSENEVIVWFDLTVIHPNTYHNPP